MSHLQFTYWNTKKKQPWHVHVSDLRGNPSCSVNILFNIYSHKKIQTTMSWADFRLLFVNRIEIRAKRGKIEGGRELGIEFLKKKIKISCKIIFFSGLWVGHMLGPFLLICAWILRFPQIFNLPHHIVIQSNHTAFKEICYESKSANIFVFRNNNIFGSEWLRFCMLRFSVSFKSAHIPN